MLLVFPQVLLKHGESSLVLGLDVVFLPKLFPEPGELDLIMARGRGGVSSRRGSGMSARSGGGVSGSGQGHGDQGGGDEGDLHDAYVRP